MIDGPGESEIGSLSELGEIEGHVCPKSYYVALHRILCTAGEL